MNIFTRIVNYFNGSDWTPKQFAPIIIAAVATSVGRSHQTERAETMQNAMVQAIKDCLAEGITDSDIIRARQLKARDIVRGVS